MSDNIKHTHLTASDRNIIEVGINNGSTKTAIAQTLGKDKSTIGKEINLHRRMTLDLSCLRLEFTSHEFEQRSLAFAILTDYANSVILLDLK